MGRKLVNTIFNIVLAMLLITVAVILIVILAGVAHKIFGDNDTIIAGVIGFAGAIIGGSLTLIGVKITLDRQDEAKMFEKAHHRKMFFMHLEQMHYRIDVFVNNFTNRDDWLIANAIPSVPNWEERLLYIDNLEESEIKVIFEWLSEFDQEVLISPNLNQHPEYINEPLKDFSGEVKTLRGTAIVRLYNNNGEKIKLILKKYKRD